MKTLRYRIGKEVKPGIVDTQGQVRDASSLVKDWDRENVTIDKLNEVKKADIGYVPNLLRPRSKLFKKIHDYLNFLFYQLNN